MNLHIMLAFHFVFVYRCQLLDSYNAPVLDNQQAPLTATINISAISTAILKSLEAPIIDVITSTVKKQIKLNLDKIIKKSEACCKNFSCSEMKLLQETVKNQEHNIEEINKTLGECQDANLEIKQKLLNTDNRTQNVELKLLQKTLKKREKEIKEIKNKLEILQTANTNIKQTVDDFQLKHQYDCVYIDKTRGSGIYKIFPLNSDEGFNVFCDMEVDGGGWTVFQRRIDGSTDFYKGWSEYENGFGDLQKEFWLGNSKLYKLTRQGDYELRIELEDFEYNLRYAKYSTFSVGGKDTKYKLTVAGYSGDAGDSFSYHNGVPFSTKDRDNDNYNNHCAQLYKGAWWYNSCHYSNLNGLYLKGKHSSEADGINWYHWKGERYSLKSTKMMTRKVPYVYCIYIWKNS